MMIVWMDELNNNTHHSQYQKKTTESSITMLGMQAGIFGGPQLSLLRATGKASPATLKDIVPISV